MEDLVKFMQASNGAFKHELMQSFIAKHRGEGYPQAPAIPAQPGFNQNTGASIFSPSTTTTTTGDANVDTTDNANILMQKMSLTDNNQTKANANTNANLTTTTTTTTSTSASTRQQSATPVEPDRNANVSEVNAVLEEVRRPMSDQQKLLLNEVTVATVDAHLATCLNTHQAVRNATARFLAMKEAGQLPDMSKMSESAGPMWQKMTEIMMPEMSKTVKFGQMLPGFNELGQMDQMKLIKLGLFEVMMTRFAMLIDSEKETMLDPSHKMICPKEAVMQMPMGKFLCGFFHVGAQFNPLGLTDGEIGLFTAILMFSPSRPGLQDVKLISAIQALYQKALFQLIKRNHSDPEEKFSKVLSLVPMFRRMSEEHDKNLAAMQKQSPDAYSQQFPPIHRQFFPTAK